MSLIKKIFSKIYKAFKKVFSLFYVRERSLILILALVIVVSIFTLGKRMYAYFTHEVPVSGGAYAESIAGQPKTINPLFSSSNIPDRAITQLVYSGLTKIDEKGNIVPDLAESWEVKENGKQFIFKLRKDIKWHDGESFSSGDVLYTISIIQDPDYLGPLKNSWKGINIETPDDYTAVFTLPEAQPVFIYDTTLGILPQHTWAEFNIADIPYVEQNLKPVGSGRFKFKDIETDENNFIKSITLERNDNFYTQKPFIESLTFKFYKNDNEAVDALNKKQVMGTGDVSFDNYAKLKKVERLRVSSYNLPGYKAVFMNSLKNPILSSGDFRVALDKAIDKEKLVNEKLQGSAILNDGIFAKDNIKNSFDLNQAKGILKNLGFVDSNNDGFLEKDGKKLELKLSLPDDKESEIVASFLKDSWSKLGISLVIEKKNLLELERDNIKPRNYELLFFGQNFGYDEDLFPFWHSSQQKDPGLNFSSYSSKRIDMLLESIKNTTDKSKRKEANEKVEELLKQDKAAIFLYSPVYHFATDKKIKGVKKHFFIYPEHRFIGIEKWYINSKRVL